LYQQKGERYHIFILAFLILFHISINRPRANQGIPCSRSPWDICSRCTFIHTLNRLLWSDLQIILTSMLLLSLYYVYMCIYLSLHSIHRYLYHSCASCMHMHTCIGRGEQAVCKHKFWWEAKREGGWRQMQVQTACHATLITVTLSLFLSLINSIAQ